jgi:hypothetical protein
MFGPAHVTTDDYHADKLVASPTLSSTLARTLIRQSPLHAWTAHPRLNPEYVSTNRRTFDIGRAAHTAALGVGDVYAVCPPDLLASSGAMSTKAAKAWIDECRAEGVTPLKQEDADAVRAMSEALRGALRDLRITFAPDQSELACVAEVHGALCRIMVDNAPADPALPLYDFKTCEDASPAACQRAIMNYGYDMQAAFYLAVWHAATGERRKFRFVFQEKSAPYEVTAIELTPTDLELSHDKVLHACEIWRRCLLADEWPGYPRGVHTLELPEFYYSKFTDARDAQLAAAPKPSAAALRAAMAMQAP